MEFRMFHPSHRRYALSQSPGNTRPRKHIGIVEPRLPACPGMLAIGNSDLVREVIVGGYWFRDGTDARRSA
jgi:hypothetical protein